MCSIASRMMIATPMVMMIKRKTDGALIPRMKENSIRAPIKAVMRTASNTAAARGMKAEKVVAIMAPIIRNSPWAKLMIPVVL